VSEAIHAANNLKAELKFTELEKNFENTRSKQLDEEQTLHGKISHSAIEIHFRKISFEIPS
jgi:hypothetical protein